VEVILGLAQGGLRLHFTHFVGSSTPLPIIIAQSLMIIYKSNEDTNKSAVLKSFCC